MNPAFSGMSALNQTLAASAFAQQIQSNPGQALQTQATTGGAAVGNPAIITRRPRLQSAYGHVEAAQAEFTGKLDVAGVHLQPLVGASWDAFWSYNVIHLNSGTAASPYYQTWDVNPSSPTYYINQAPTPILTSQYNSAPSTDTLGYSSDQAAYGLLNASFLHDQQTVAEKANVT